MSSVMTTGLVTPLVTARAPRQLGAGRTRIALLSTWYPTPADNGRKQRTQQMIVELAREYDIALIALLPPDEIVQRQLQPLEGVWQQWALPLPQYQSNSIPALLAGLSLSPRSTVMTWSPRTARSIAQIVAETDCTLALGTDLRTLRYLLALAPQTMTILDEPDVSPFIMAQTPSRYRFGRLRAFVRRQKYRRLLHSATHRLTTTIVASQQEAWAYQQLADSDRVKVIENSVGDFPARAWQTPTGAQLLYNGAIGYGPNADAVAFFAREILPQIVAAEPDARLIVTGAIPRLLPPGIADQHVTLTGLLDTDALTATYLDSRVCVVPLSTGTGTRIKVLEALAHGIPIVTTMKGVEGLEVTHGEHLLIADTPADFAAATLRLLHDTALATRLSAQGRAHVRRRYSWEARGRELRALIDTYLSTKRDGDC